MEKEFYRNQRVVSAWPVDADGQRLIGTVTDVYPSCIFVLWDMSDYGVVCLEKHKVVII